MKTLILSVLGATCLCAAPAFAQEAGNVTEGNPGPQYGTMEWIHRYGPNAYPAHPIHPYAVPVPRALGRDSATARREREREREIAALREREIALQREREIALQREREIALQRERERDIATRRDRERGWDGTGMRRDRDRDGDGIANRRDRHPDDPSRF